MVSLILLGCKHFNIFNIIQDIFAAGTDTSAKVLEWDMAEMMRNQRVKKWAQR